MVHCKKSWVWTVRQFVIPWLCSHWRTTFWVSSDGRRSEDTSSRVRCLPVEDKLKTSRLFLNQTWSDLVKSRSANRFFRLLQLQYSMRLSKSYHIVLSQGLTPVWVFPPAGQHVAASRQRSARVPLRDRLGPHESSHLVSWEEEKGKERLRFSQHCESKHVNIDQHVQVYILVMHLQEVKPFMQTVNISNQNPSIWNALLYKADFTSPRDQTQLISGLSTWKWKVPNISVP